jgi:hypothetical protein
MKITHFPRIYSLASQGGNVHYRIHCSPPTDPQLADLASLVSCHMYSAVYSGTQRFCRNVGSCLLLEMFLPFLSAFLYLRAHSSFYSLYVRSLPRHTAQVPVFSSNTFQVFLMASLQDNATVSVASHRYSLDKSTRQRERDAVKGPAQPPPSSPSDVWYC